MKRILVTLLLSLFILSSCGSAKKKKTSASRRSVATKTYSKPRVSSAKLPYEVVKNALQFKGVPYKFGGTTRKGMDCSGLVYVAFKEEQISLPRVSRDMAKRGTSIRTKDITVGDLLFFKTNKNSSQINHVGLVVDILPDQILFIHSTTSKGVLISSLNEGYWNNAYVEARRIL